jgi:chromosome segregation ATPase
MKAEDKIIELLSEYLQKTDRLLDRMEKTDRRMEQTDRNIEIMSKAILDHSIKFNEITDDIRNLSKENNRLREDQGIVLKDIKRLGEENNNMREDQGTMLKELLSISKRVSKLEDKA